MERIREMENGKRVDVTHGRRDGLWIRRSVAYKELGDVMK